jgi:hypothetical protein
MGLHGLLQGSLNNTKRNAARDVEEGTDYHGAISPYSRINSLRDHSLVG